MGRLRAKVPEEQLLIWDPADGWKPLCEFLGASKCPTEALAVFNDLISWQKAAEAEGVRNKSVFDYLEYLWLPLCINVFAFAFYYLFMRRRASASKSDQKSAEKVD